jgi:hypothetical protein
MYLLPKFRLSVCNLQQTPVLPYYVLPSTTVHAPSLTVPFAMVNRNLPGLIQQTVQLTPQHSSTKSKYISLIILVFPSQSLNYGFHTKT